MSLLFFAYIYRMNLYQLRSDIQLLGEMLKLSKDTRLIDDHIDFLIHEHRARAIREEFARNKYIDPSWVQDFGKVTVTPVFSGDDPGITMGSVKLGKITMPQVVSLPLDKGVYRVGHTSKFDRYYYIEADRFFSLVPDSITAKFAYYFRVGTAFYLSPCTSEANLMLILDNPMDGVVLLTEKVAQDDLTIGVSYTVYQAQIVSNSVAYNQGSVFTATATTYTGAGYVKYTTQKRAITDRDPYPMSLTMFEYIVMKIFTEDFFFSRQAVADAINDAQDQLIINQNPDAARTLKTPKEGD